MRRPFPAPSLTSGPGAGGRRALRPLPVGLGAVAIFTWWAVEDGAASPAVAYPGVLLFLAALVVVAIRTGFAGLPRPALWALAALAGFTLWSFASIAWADARGDAWEAADRALLYLVVFALFAALPWRPAEAVAVLGAFALAIAATGIWAVAAAIAGTEPPAFRDGRLAGPVGYENATAALLITAFWPALLIAARRSTPRVARAALLAAAGVLIQLVVLAQSRGSVAAFAASLGLVMLLHGDRGRLLVCLAAVGVTTVAALPALLRAYGTAGEADGDVRGALVAVAAAMGASAVVLVVAGLAADRLHRRPGSSPAAGLRARWVAGVAALAVLAALAASAPDTRLTAGAASGRYDFWRVAAGQLADHPLHGAGAGNFAHDYVRERRRFEEPLYPHSVILGAAGQLGLVGTSVLTGFFAAAFVGLRRLGGPDDPRRAIGLVGVAVAAAWLTHASIDWLWELPALTAPAFALLGLVQGLGHGRSAIDAVAGERSSDARRAGEPAALRLVRRVGGAALVCAAASSLALPALAARDVEHAVRDWRTDPAGALAALERAHDLDPLSTRADVVGGALTIAEGDEKRARRFFARAVERDAADWYAQVQLALLDLEQSRPAPALARLEQARRLNPREPLIAAAMAAARGGGPPPDALRGQLASVAIAAPLGRRPVNCRPVLGIDCSRQDDR